MQSHEAHQGRMFTGGMSLLQMLGQAEQGRRGMGLQALQTAGGFPQAPNQNWGQPMMDIGQLLLLQQLMGGGGGQQNMPRGGGNFGSPTPVDPILGRGA